MHMVFTQLLIQAMKDIDKLDTTMQEELRKFDEAFTGPHMLKEKVLYCRLAKAYGSTHKKLIFSVHREFAPILHIVETSSRSQGAS